jgi:hypothetical protein
MTAVHLTMCTHSLLPLNCGCAKCLSLCSPTPCSINIALLSLLLSLLLLLLNYFLASLIIVVSIKKYEYLLCLLVVHLLPLLLVVLTLLVVLCLMFISDTCIAVPAAEQAMELFAKLPEVNKKVLTSVIDLLQRISGPDNVGKSKMTADNLAMVFAPCFMRYSYTHIHTHTPHTHTHTHTTQTSVIDLLQRISGPGNVGKSKMTLIILLWYLHRVL